MPSASPAHVLSIRDSQSDEQLIESVWGEDSGVRLTHVECGVKALEYLRSPKRLVPNLILLAWRVQAEQMTAVETLLALKDDPIFRAIPVLVLADVLSPWEIQDLYAHHVACVFDMGDSLERLEHILRRSKELWLDTAQLPYRDEPPASQEVPLSAREIEILRLTAEDLAAKEIAHRLNISTRTVDFHRESIKRRLGVQGTAGMVRYAIKKGLLEP